MPFSKRMNSRTFSIAIFITVLVAACTVDPDVNENFTVSGFVPVYGAYEKSEIKTTPPIPLNDPGKIYIYDPYLLINERGKGIHVYNNSDPANPSALTFIQMVGNTDMAIKDNILYADHMGDLVAITFSDFENVLEKGRLPLSSWNLGLPAPAQSYFECIDPAKGLVVDWKPATLTNPDCYAF